MKAFHLKPIPMSFPSRLLYSLVAFGLGFGSLTAQTGSGTPLVVPDAPLWKPVPNYAQWVITYSYPADRDKNLSPAQRAETLDGLTRTETTTKCGKFIHQEFVDTKGVPGDLWYVTGTEYFRSTGPTPWTQVESFSNGRPNPSYTPFPAKGFKDLDWVSGADYAGTVNYQNRPCFVFIPGGATALRVTDLSAQADKLASMTHVAVIDAETRLPVEVRSAGVIAGYQFKDAPSSNTNPIPSDLIAYIKQGEEGRARSFQTAARPY